METLYFLSHSVVLTSQGVLAELMFNAEDTWVSALKGFNNPPGQHPVSNPIYAFISGLQGFAGSIYQVTEDTHTNYIHKWELVVKTATKVQNVGVYFYRDSDGNLCGTESQSFAEGRHHSRYGPVFSQVIEAPLQKKKA